MTIPSMNVNGIAIDECGRVVLSDAELGALATSCELTLAGGANDTNHRCANGQNCGGSSNKQCANATGQCGGSTNIQECIEMDTLPPPD